MTDCVIFQPEPFFSTYGEGMSKSITEIKNRHETLLKESSFNSISKMSFYSQSLYEDIFNNIYTVRQCLLLHLSQQPEAIFFDSTQSDDFLGFSLKTPFKSEIFKDYSIFQYIYTNARQSQDIFANVIREYFKADLTFLTEFGWSTFPAFYGFFANDKDCQDGANLIRMFISLPTETDINISNVMMSSFFMCSFNFNRAFCSKVYFYSISNDNFDDDQFFDFFIESITSSSYLLSKSHKDIISSFFTISPSRCINFLMIEFLMRILKIFFRKNDFLVSKNHLEFLYKFLANCAKASRTDKGIKISKAFTESKSDSCSIPRLPVSKELAKIPTIFSFRDVAVLCDILDYSDDNKRLFNVTSTILTKNKKQFLENGFIPFCIDRVIGRYTSNHFDVFNDAPIEFLNKRKGIFGSNQNPFDYLKNHQTHNKDFEKFIYLYEIRRLEDEYKHLSLINSISELRLINHNFHDSIEPFFTALLDIHCESQKNQYLKEVKTGKIQSNRIGKRINKAMNIIYQKQEIVNIISFPMFLAVIDSYELDPDLIYAKLMAAFLMIVSSKKKETEKKILPYRKSKRIIDLLCSKLSKSIDWPLGRQYSAFLYFVDCLKIIDDRIKAEKMITTKLFLFFAYSMCKLENASFLNTYLLTKKVIAKNKEYVEQQWDPKLKQANQILDECMKSFLGFDKHTLACCISYQFEQVKLVSK